RARLLRPRGQAAPRVRDLGHPRHRLRLPGARRRDPDRHQQHVAERPEVTDDEHPVDGVPPGSKKVREQLKIVRNEEDDYEPGPLALSKVPSDPASDIAIVKAHKLLPLMPFRVGRSSALRPGNLVQVRGFPLGAFSAVSVGKVVNPYTEDTEKGWSHSDF